jgi:hypothetical protein
MFAGEVWKSSGPTFAHAARRSHSWVTSATVGGHANPLNTDLTRALVASHFADVAMRVVEITPKFGVFGD